MEEEDEVQLLFAENLALLTENVKAQVSEEAEGAEEEADGQGGRDAHGRRCWAGLCFAMMARDGSISRWGWWRSGLFPLSGSGGSGTGRLLLACRLCLICWLACLAQLR